VPVAVEVARALDTPVDLVFVRKIGVPFQPELAAAGIVDGGDAEIVVNEDVMKSAGIFDMAKGHPRHTVTVYHTADSSQRAVRDDATGIPS
jgi:predicted phosphoribosyltransferase